MLVDSLLVRHEVFVSTAVVAAHTSAKGEGFRQRDVRFFIELFANWVESARPERSLLVQNTQVQRYLDGLAKEGYARKLSRDKKPLYRLTRVGLLELVSRAVNPKVTLSKEHFYFLLYYIKHYRPLLEELIKKEGRQFPYALKLELDTLFDPKDLVNRELARAGQELKLIERRISDNLALSKLAVEMSDSGAKAEEIAKEAERLYPYELNNQKAFSELMSELPSGMQLWELRAGTRNRAKEIWEPMREGLRTYIEELKKI